MIVYDIWAEWCPPCKRFAPIFEMVAEEFEDVTFSKVRADSNPDFLNLYEISSIPTILAVDDSGRIISRHTGILSLEKFRLFVSEALLQSHK